jgi:hypothetical protein
MASFVMSISPSSRQAIPQAVPRYEWRQAADRQLRCFNIEGAGINDLVVLEGYNPDRLTLPCGQE